MYTPNPDERYYYALKSYLKKNPGKKERDFLTERLEEFHRFEKECSSRNGEELKELVPGTVDDFNGRPVTYERKLFINKMLRDDYIIRHDRLPREEKIEETGMLSGPEKIILLHKLGVLEYLQSKQPFQNSTNSLARIVGLITGIKQTSAQSYINPINNPSTVQSNNPLNKQEKVSKIENILSKIGFNSSI